jgi:putative FmdB family regulatory protein
MPIYEYRCRRCGHQFEAFRTPKEREGVRCTKCGAPVRRLLSPVGVIFKGSGFHVTDYGPNGRKKPEPPFDELRVTPSKAEGPPKPDKSPAASETVAGSD